MPIGTAFFKGGSTFAPKTIGEGLKIESIFSCQFSSGPVTSASKKWSLADGAIVKFHPFGFLEYFSNRYLDSASPLNNSILVCNRKNRNSFDKNLTLTI